MLKVGDKVKINVDVVGENGLFDSEEQEGQYQYIASHIDEVYTVKSVSAKASAHIQLDHPVVGSTSFFEQELIVIEKENKEEKLKKQILKIMNAEDSHENYEKVAEAVFDSISSEDESYSHIGYHILHSFLSGNADGMLSAICGWSMKSILAKAGLIPDEEKVFIDAKEE